MSTVSPAMATTEPFLQALSALQRMSQLFAARHSTEERQALWPVLPGDTALDGAHVGVADDLVVLAGGIPEAAHRARAGIAFDPGSAGIELRAGDSRQASPLHVTFWFAQADSPLHTTLHADASAQSMLAAHASLPVHRTSHGTPGGHVTGAFLHGPPSHEITHQPPSHVPASPHAAKQFACDASMPPSNGFIGGGGGVASELSPSTASVVPSMGLGLALSRTPPSAEPSVASLSSSAPMMERPHAMALAANRAQQMTTRTLTSPRLSRAREGAPPTSRRRDHRPRRAGFGVARRLRLLHPRRFTPNDRRERFVERPHLRLSDDPFQVVLDCLQHGETVEHRRAATLAEPNELRAGVVGIGARSSMPISTSSSTSWPAACLVTPSRAASTVRRVPSRSTCGKTVVCATRTGRFVLLRTSAIARSFRSRAALNRSCTVDLAFSDSSFSA